MLVRSNARERNVSKRQKEHSKETTNIALHKSQGEIGILFVRLNKTLVDTTKIEVDQKIYNSVDLFAGAAGYRKGSRMQDLGQFLVSK